jgi:hypothetical protein
MFEVYPIPRNISDFKKAIKAEKPHDLGHCDADTLDMWLSPTRHIQQPDDGVPCLNPDDMLEPGRYYYVEAPAPTARSSVDTNVTDFALAAADPWATKSQTTSESAFLPVCSWRSQEYLYLCCVLKGLYTSEQLAGFEGDRDGWTVGAHIIPFSTEKALGPSSFGALKKLLGLDWDFTTVPQNGLPLCRELELQFDLLNVCFICVPQQQKWRVKVLSPELHGIVYLTSRVTKRRTKFQPPDLTWERINDTEVNIDDVVSHRVLLYHAQRASEKHGVSLELCGDSKRKNSNDWVRERLQGVVHPPIGPNPDPVSASESAPLRAGSGFVRHSTRSPPPGADTPTEWWTCCST